MDLDFAKAPREADLIATRHLMPPEQKKLVPQEGVMNGREQRIIDLCNADAQDLGTETPLKRSEL
jgi:hypothetical protein